MGLQHPSSEKILTRQKTNFFVFERRALGRRYRTETPPPPQSTNRTSRTIMALKTWLLIALPLLIVVTIAAPNPESVEDLHNGLQNSEEDVSFLADLEQLANLKNMTARMDFPQNLNKNSIGREKRYSCSDCQYAKYCKHCVNCPCNNSKYCQYCHYCSYCQYKGFCCFPCFW